MRGDIVIRHNSLPVEREWDGEEQPPLSVPGRWRRLRMRFGPIEFNYASVRLLPPPARQVERLGRAPLHSRFFEHLGLTLAALVFLGGSASLIAMQSGAFVPSKNSWQIVSTDAELGGVTAAPLPDAASPVVEATARPAPFVAAPPVTPTVPAPVAKPATATPKPAFVEAAPVKEAVGQGAEARSGPLDRIPAVARAIQRAMASGEVQDWSSGMLSGVVVVGEAYEADGKLCREGSVLARDGGPTGRTQSFERCTRN